MKVIQVASGDLWAGAENVVYHLCRGLDLIDDVDVQVVLLNHGRLSELCVNSCIHTTVLDEQVLRFNQIVLRFMRHVYREQPDIIHSHRYKENILVALARPTVEFSNMVTTVHGLGESSSLKSRIKPNMLLDRLLRRLFFARQVAVSDDIACRLGVHKQWRNNIVRIYNGIEMPDAAEMRRKANGVVSIGSAGRLVPVKEYALMIDVAAEVCRKRDDVRFVLAGEGPLRSDLNALIIDRGLEGRVTLLGEIDDMSVFYSGLDVYLNTSRHEGTPMTILEAMAWGCPVVAPRVGGLPEIINDGLDGFLIEPRDVDGFADCILGLVDSREKRLQVGKSAMKKSWYYSREYMVEQYIRLYAAMDE